MTQVILDNFHLGGIADSRYAGMDNSLYKIENINLHEEPGIIKAQQGVKIDRTSGALVSTDAVNMIYTAKGLGGYADSARTFIFQSNGSVLTRTSAGVYASAFTTSESNCRDALAFGSWIPPKVDLNIVILLF